jgi:hypothetical protein
VKPRSLVHGSNVSKLGASAIPGRFKPSPRVSLATLVWFSCRSAG